jgi:type II secretory ATPase GspE/PulE/Tfp pilus assembly ATPase PilB-like protein
MVGEIRDPETAAIAVQAGLTGHLVLSTIHCGVSAGAFTRLINMEIEPFMLASSILGVMGLRLVRSICPNCAQPYEPTPSQLKVVPEALVSQAQFRRGDGCEQCNQTGFAGRLPVSELLTQYPLTHGGIFRYHHPALNTDVTGESAIRPSPLIACTI